MTGRVFLVTFSLLVLQLLRGAQRNNQQHRCLLLKLNMLLQHL
ncbi:hypothetical protein MTR67_051610 [Solanum verrucosum]|uniref:Uncharacterized protein n=1 Tax=Solanum verrucosum TaxID=315347 RepID=A0AAF0V480_SOLVR|nr:hypothetical protein MTR67_051610 [Solanum verrucosum]